MSSRDSSLKKLLSETRPDTPEREQTQKVLRSIRDTEEWCDAVLACMRERVEADLIKNHQLVPDIETIDAHVQRCPSELFNAGRTYARLQKLLYDAEKNLQAVTRSNKRTLARVRALVHRAVLANKDITEKKTLDFLEHTVSSHHQVQREEQEGEQRQHEAEQKYAEALEHSEGLKYLVQSIELKGNLLMGLQGMKNRSMPSQHNRNLA